MEYLIGTSVGLAQVIVGYPFDTMKVNYQNGYIKKLTVRELMRGIRYPIIGSCLSNTLFFGNYDILYKQTNNIALSGFITGFVGAIFLNPFEYRKVNNQSVLRTSLSNPSNIKSIYGGLEYTITRESIANAIYFSAYYYSRDELKFNAFISGGIAGINSWFWTYPIDTIKTRKQLNLNRTLRDIIKEGRLFRGLHIALFRAFFVNGAGFYIFDKLHNKDTYEE